jgi:hypothetical protein
MPTQRERRIESSQGGGEADSTAGALTPEQVAARQKWAEDAKNAIYDLFNDRSKQVPSPERLDSPSVTISPTASKDLDHPQAQMDVGSRATAFGSMVRTANIVIFPSGSKTYADTFVSLGHEFGHLVFGLRGEDLPEAYGRELYRIHTEGGSYEGPRP